MSPIVLWLAVATCAVVLAALWAIDRSVRRRVRRERREREQDLAQAFADVLAGRGDAAALRHEAATCEHGTLWSALEAMTPRRRDRRALAALLAGNPHVAAECEALRDDSPWRRELAARRLALVPSPGTRRALREALASGPEVVTHAAALALARQRDGAALEWLLLHPHAIARRTPRARVGLLHAFGRPAHRVLAEALGRELEPSLAQAAIETLGLARHAAARAAIERRLADPALEVRVAAARALGRIGDRESVAPLSRALLDDAWPVRAQAAWALGRIGEPQALACLPPRLADPAFWVRRHAARALAALGEPGRELLRHVAAGSPDPYARDASREALDRSA